VNNYITALRDIVPLRSLSAAETLHLAERQATKLLRLVGLTEPPLPEDTISQVRRVQIERVPMDGAHHAASRWIHDRWLILLNADDCSTRQRWSLTHEFKHILDHPFESIIYRRGDSTTAQTEQACEYFAACLLMPRRWVRRAWRAGIREPEVLAETFGVSPHAMRVRLLQIGLIPATSHHLMREA
jgi:Zn-dependent peptidase ImmA (M78 family)